MAFSPIENLRNLKIQFHILTSRTFEMHKALWRSRLVLGNEIRLTLRGVTGC